MTSGMAMGQASTFTKIPVYVPTSTPWAHGSVVIAPNSAHIPSSAFRAMPTGVSPEENHRDASSSPSSHGPVEFTGDAAKFSLGASSALVSVLAGVCAVLALAL
ncbi:hypothetical protein BJX99DRAFT_257878 [Aspergillus californicus]